MHAVTLSSLFCPSAFFFGLSRERAAGEIATLSASGGAEVPQIIAHQLEEFSLKLRVCRQLSRWMFECACLCVRTPFQECMTACARVDGCVSVGRWLVVCIHVCLCPSLWAPIWLTDGVVCGPQSKSKAVFFFWFPPSIQKPATSHCFPTHGFRLPSRCLLTSEAALANQVSLLFCVPYHVSSAQGNFGMWMLG